MWIPFEEWIDSGPKRKPPNPPGVLEFVRSRLGFFPDARQAEILESTAAQGILNCSRQWGKSTVSAAKALHRAYHVPGCLVLVASPGERQSAEWMRKARVMTGGLGSRLRGDGDNKISLVLPNGSRIVGLPGMDATVRGFSAVSMLVIDEAARVEESLYKALRPVLAVSNGDVWLMSTPYGRRGFFYEVWEHGGPEWFRVHGQATECPRISKAFLEKERGAMGALSFRQEYMGEFVDSGSSLFERSLIEAALDDLVEPLVFE
ncbi:MAG TPA: terminase family protein [Bryobacteraceae bacterium]|nr:terminase family protein [Bryobacteraceae bacterium]